MTGILKSSVESRLHRPNLFAYQGLNYKSYLMNLRHQINLLL